VHVTYNCNELLLQYKQNNCNVLQDAVLSFSDMFNISACLRYLDGLTYVVGSYYSTFFLPLLVTSLVTGILVFRVAYFSCP
jgi:hypothetical protein